MYSVSIRDLSLSFGSVPVLKSLNLDVKQGEFIVLLGPSGCGKSTLLNCIAGLLDVTDGQVFISGNNVTWKEPKDRGIGMVFQSYALYPQMSVEKNLSFGLRVSGMGKKEIGERVDRTAAILQIETLLKRKPGALSGGQRQRVAIGRALVRDADVFLFDEPLSNLDAKLRSELRVEIKRLHQKLGNTMVYVTHDQIEALTLADRVAVMKDGIIQQLDDPHVVYDRPANLFVAGFIGSPSMNFIDGLVVEQDGQLWHRSADLRLALRAYQPTTRLAANRQARLGLRPEHITLNETGVAPDIETEVELVEPMGADSLVWLRIADKPLSVRVGSEQRFRPGEMVKLSFNIPKASLFDSEEELRI